MKNEKVHFVGIGGIGISALARYYLSEGALVSGSDLVSTEITDDLTNEGAKIKIGTHKKTNIPKNTNLVIYTAAAPKDNRELEEARKRKIKTQSYAEALGALTRHYDTITISGSHGKSTTTGLSALVLEEGYFDPTVIVGTRMKEFSGHNFRKGHGRFLVLEADEWNESFLNYSPKIAMVTNIDAEHLDTYKTHEAVERAFEKYLSRVSADGAIIANCDDPRLYSTAKRFGKMVVWYSQKDKDWGIIKKVLKISGDHNVYNALAALKLGRIMGIHEPAILKALSRFSGAWRRFEYKGNLNGASIFDDYGHHPSEITATIKTARQKFPFRRIWCVYQPHQFQRLQYLWNDFKSAFDLADRVCLLPVYDVAGRETKKAKGLVNSLNLAGELISRGKNAVHIQSFAEAKNLITSETRAGDIVLIMGAGDIYLLTKSIFEVGSNELAAEANKSCLKLK